MTPIALSTSQMEESKSKHAVRHYNIASVRITVAIIESVTYYIGTYCWETSFYRAVDVLNRGFFVVDTKIWSILTVRVTVHCWKS